jgi:hypothetical protein
LEAGLEHVGGLDEQLERHLPVLRSLLEGMGGLGQRLQEPLARPLLPFVPVHWRGSSERHGGKAVVISRFLPIIRTYVPFVAGMARMHPREFLAYNAGGAVLWAGGLLYAGYFFGNIPWIRGNLTAIIVGIIVVSLAPLAWAFVRSRFGKP